MPWIIGRSLATFLFPNESFTEQFSKFCKFSTLIGFLDKSNSQSSKDEWSSLTHICSCLNKFCLLSLPSALTFSCNLTTVWNLSNSQQPCHFLACFGEGPGLLLEEVEQHLQPILLISLIILQKGVYLGHLLLSIFFLSKRTFFGPITEN